MYLAAWLGMSLVVLQLGLSPHPTYANEFCVAHDDIRDVDDEVDDFAGSVIVITNADYELILEDRGNVCSLKIPTDEYTNWLAGGQSFSDVQVMSARVYAHFQDLFDFIVFINDVDDQSSGYAGRHYGIQNDVSGIGKSIFDSSASYGSGGELESVIHLREQGHLRGGPSLHEFCHRWANSLADIPNAGSHWGFSSVGGQLGGWHAGTLSNLHDHTYDANGPSGSSGFGTVANGGNGLPYSELELYVMGMVPSSFLSNQIKYAENAAFTNSSIGVFTSAVIQTMSIGDIITTEGARSPAAGSSQTNFRSIVVVLNDGYLSASRWDEFDEAVTNFSRAGSDGSSLYNFWEATGGRATMEMGNLFGSLQSNVTYASITPSDSFYICGDVGGPFSTCSVYTVTNRGVSALAWSAAGTQAWLSVTPASGVLAPGGATSVTACVNSTADALGIGVYRDTLAVLNVSNGVTTTRDVELTVKGPASMPFADGFEDGLLQPYWGVSGTVDYRTQVTDANGPSNDYHVVMDDSVSDSTWSRNELTLTVDLAGYTNIVLSFLAKMFLDEPDGPPSSPFYDGANFDGVAISESEDTNAWYEVQGLRSLSASYVEYTVDLDAAIATYGLSYSSTFQIRFNQYDNFSATQDGIAIDNIAITGNLIEVLADVGVTKTSHAALVASGSNVTYEIVVSNAGPAVADAVAVTDTLPGNDVLYVSATEGCIESGGIVSCLVGALAPGAATQLFVTVTLTNADHVGHMTNYVMVTTTSSDTNALNDASAAVVSLDHDGDGLGTAYEGEGVDVDGDGLLSFEDSDETYDGVSVTLGGSQAVTSTWNAVSGAVYELRYRWNLADTNGWVGMGVIVTAGGDSVSLVDTNGSATQKFYRTELIQFPE